MRTRTATITIALALAASMLTALAQDQPRPKGGPPREGGPGGDQRRPVPPLLAALDANRDGVIDEREIANASAALRKLDKNGDGKLTMDELMPPRPEGDIGRRPGGDPGRRPPGGGDRPGGPRPEGDKGQPKRQRPPAEP